MALLLIGLLVLGTAPKTYAAEFLGGNTVVVGADEVIDDDLFVTGERVEINGTVRGNLFAGGAEVVVNGPVEGSLFISGRTLAVNDAVGGSAHIGGYSFTLGSDATVARNLFFGGFSLSTEAGSQVGRSLYGGGYQMILAGDVANDANVGAGALELYGTVGGDLVGEVSTAEEAATPFMPPFEGAVTPIDPGLRIADSATVGGDVRVVLLEPESDEEVVTTPIGTIQTWRLRWAVGEFIALLIIGAIVLAWRPTLLRRTSTMVQTEWLPSLNFGALALLIAVVGFPILLALVIALTVVGGWLSLGNLVGDILGVGLATWGLALALFLFIAVTFTKVVMGYWGGRLILRPEAAARASAMEYVALALGVLIYILLRLIPFGIGWLIGLAATMFGLGALYLAYRNTPPRAPASAPAAPTDTPADTTA
jgi:hypothetical protein